MQVTKIEATAQQRAVVRYAAYARVSRNTEDQLQSFASQLRYYNTLFNDSSSEILVELYADEGLTGTDLEKRTDFKRMMADARQHKFDILIANPSLAENNEDKPYTPTDEIVRREQNISNSLASSTVEANEIIKAIMQNAEKKYECCSYDDTAEITKKIKEKLTEHAPLKSFDLMLFEEIVEEIQPDIGCSIYMKLKNGAIIQHAIKRGENNERRS